MNNPKREIVLPDGGIEAELRRRSRRSFLVAGLASAAGIGAYEWMRFQPQEDRVPWPQRRVLTLNEKLAEAYFSDAHLVPTYSLKDVQYIKPNGDIGLDDDEDDEHWKVKVQSDSSPVTPVTLNAIKALPKVETITKFCCIEGWSRIAHWSGARFSDFTRKYMPSANQFQYVSMTTPNEDYYVGLDMKSALHPQTLLVYEKDGQPLPDDHGAPLRLLIPVKYGIKNLKRIGAISYTNDRPDDYWAEEGYDWFAGL